MPKQVKRTSGAVTNRKVTKLQNELSSMQAYASKLAPSSAARAGVDVSIKVIKRELRREKNK